MTRYRLQISNDYLEGASYYFAGPFRIPASGQSFRQINLEHEYEKDPSQLDENDVAEFIELLKQTLSDSKYKEIYQNKLKLLSDKDSVFVFIKDVGEHNDNEIFFRPSNTKIMEVAHIDEEGTRLIMNRLYIIKEQDIQLNTVINFVNVNVPEHRKCPLTRNKIQIF